MVLDEHDMLYHIQSIFSVLLYPCCKFVN